MLGQACTTVHARPSQETLMADRLRMSLRICKGQSNKELQVQQTATPCIAATNKHRQHALCHDASGNGSPKQDQS